MNDPRTWKNWQFLKPAIKRRKLKEYFKYHQTAEELGDWKETEEEFCTAVTEQELELTRSEALIRRIEEVNEEISD